MYIMWVTSNRAAEAVWTERNLRYEWFVQLWTGGRVPL